MPQDQNGNELEATTSSNTTSTTTADQTQQVCGMTEKQNRINRNLAKFLSTEKQQQQLLLCLRQQQLPQQQQIRLGALTSMTVACNFFYFLYYYCLYKKYWGLYELKRGKKYDFIFEIE